MGFLGEDVNQGLLKPSPCSTSHFPEPALGTPPPPRGRAVCALETGSRFHAFCSALDKKPRAAAEEPASLPHLGRVPASGASSSARRPGPSAPGAGAGRGGDSRGGAPGPGCTSGRAGRGAAPARGAHARCRAARLPPPPAPRPPGSRSLLARRVLKLGGWQQSRSARGPSSSASRPRNPRRAAHNSRPLGKMLPLRASRAKSMTSKCLLCTEGWVL